MLSKIKVDGGLTSLLRRLYRTEAELRRLQAAERAFHASPTDARAAAALLQELNRQGQYEQVRSNFFKWGQRGLPASAEMAAQYLHAQNASASGPGSGSGMASSGSSGLRMAGSVFSPPSSTEYSASSTPFWGSDSPAPASAPPPSSPTPPFSGYGPGPIPVSLVMNEPLPVSQVKGRSRLRTFVEVMYYGLLILFALTLLRPGGPTGGLLGQSEPKRAEMVNVRFSDVRGIDEVRDELKEVVAFLSNPTKFRMMGAKIPKGVLLAGPPGTGKTLLARAVAGEAGVPFFYASGSEFDEVFVGVGSQRIRKLFSEAKKAAPAIIFIDEIDSIGLSRKAMAMRNRDSTLNQLLTEMDGFEQNTGVIVIAATNMQESLDAALVRPGRFDKVVTVPLPDMRGRFSVLELHSRGVKLAPDVDLMQIARGTPGFSGADLENLINRAAIKASLANEPHVTNAILESAKDDILMGVARKSQVMPEENRRLTAYHEGGHALVALYSQDSTPIHKATILPRGNALGMVSQLPEKDQYSMSKRQLLSRIAVAMGGRAAEEMIFGTEKVTTGASSDFQQATRLAREMVLRLGMGNATGKLYIADEDLDRLSPEARSSLETEIRRIVDQAYSDARSILASHSKELHLLAGALLEHETLSREEILLAIHGNLPLPPS